MATGPKGEAAGAAARRDEEALGARVKERVLQVLGSPSNWYEVRVQRLWKDRYRVNVFVGEDVLTGRIEHSFFLVSDDNGNILESTPRLTRQYELTKKS